MRDSYPPTNAESSSAVARYSLIAMFLTTVHHVYGAYAYDTPWRLHVTFIAGGAAVLILGAYSVMRSHPADRIGTVARWLFVLSVLVIPVVLFGGFEGFYNHLVKNVLYFGGLPPSTMAQLFPPPEYELPNDAFFEITGVLQVVPTVLVMKHLYRMLAGGGRRGTAGRQRVRIGDAGARS